MSYLFRIGPVAVKSPITLADVREWRDTTGIELQPWQSELLVQLSCEYFAEMRAAREYNAPAPWPEAAAMWRWVRGAMTNSRMKLALQN